MNKRMDCRMTRGSTSQTARLGLILLSFVVAGCAQKPDPGDRTRGPEPAVGSQVDEAAAAKEPAGKATVDVFLFHGTYRCYSCNKMEELTLQVLDESFAEQKENGAVTFRHVNVDEDEKRHYVDDCKIHAISIILSRKEGGKGTQRMNLDQVWVLLRNEEKSKQYKVKEIGTYLN